MPTTIVDALEVPTEVATLSDPRLRDCLVERPGPCLTSDDPDAWYPLEPRAVCTEGRREEYVAEARALCAACPVRMECLELALRTEAETGDCHGVWGGTAPWEREALIQVRRTEVA